MSEETLGFETLEYEGYKLKSYYLNNGTNTARIEIWKGKDCVNEGIVPAYKIWNYAAHMAEIIEDYIVNNVEVRA